MSGSSAIIRVSGSSKSCKEVLDRIETFAYRRLSFRSVNRLEGTAPEFGYLPSEWNAMGVTPADLDLRDEWWLNLFPVTREEDKDASLRDALNWPLGPWLGLDLSYDIPPQQGGFPDSYGACHWRVWCEDEDAWRRSGAIEYPTSTVGRDERWPRWLDEFVAAVE